MSTGLSSLCLYVGGIKSSTKYDWESVVNEFTKDEMEKILTDFFKLAAAMQGNIALQGTHSYVSTPWTPHQSEVKASVKIVTFKGKSVRVLFAEDYPAAVADPMKDYEKMNKDERELLKNLMGNMDKFKSKDGWKVNTKFASYVVNLETGQIRVNVIEKLKENPLDQERKKNNGSLPSQEPKQNNGKNSKQRKTKESTNNSSGLKFNASLLANMVLLLLAFT